MNPADLRGILKENLDYSMEQLNEILAGRHLEQIIPSLTHVYSKHVLPHWFSQLQKDHTLPNLDGKTIGSILEMLYVSVLETYVFSKYKISLSLNPAKGIDIPELELGIKSPSENYCTSEPFFSPYERILGNPYDILVLLTNYQDEKKNPPLKIQIIKWKYLNGSQVSDANLCGIARKHRGWLLQENSTELQKVICFLTHVVKSDWLPRILLKLIDVLNDEEALLKTIELSKKDFETKNKKNEKAGKDLIPAEDLEVIDKIQSNTPLYISVINAANNWVIDYHKNFGRMPSPDEWSRFLVSPLDGVIGMSYALQWRYNFSSIFNIKNSDKDEI